MTQKAIRPIAQWAEEEGWSGGLFEDNIRATLSVFYGPDESPDDFMRNLFIFLREEFQRRGNDTKESIK